MHLQFFDRHVDFGLLNGDVAQHFFTQRQLIAQWPFLVQWGVQRLPGLIQPTLDVLKLLLALLPFFRHLLEQCTLLAKKEKR